tara:strand:- start:188 stop:1363 length:1176 start_codon:yes stop_codon:yes gene_type:complete
VKILNLKNIKKYFLTTVNIFKIFYISNKLFKRNNSIKFIFFYFPVRAYQKNIIELVNQLNKKRNIKAYLIYNSQSSKELAFKKNSFFIDFGYFRFVPFVNYFLSRINYIISSYVNYIFLPNTINIYISHDIYDTPMVNKEIENKLFTELSKLDYIFVSADIVKDYFEKKFVEYSDSKKKNNTKIINTGYLKLDHVCRELKLIKNKQNQILIAPTASKHYQSINLSFHINKIIQFLLQKKYQVIYRPHPMDLTYKGNHKLIKKINQRFKNDDNFFLDISNSYLESYSKSFILITDFSGTAYTYSFSQNKPVIFFSYNENEIIKKELSKLNYFIDRKKIGYIVNNFTVLNQKLKKIQKNNILFGKKIDKLKKIRIKNFGNSLKVTKKTIESML